MLEMKNIQISGSVILKQLGNKNIYYALNLESGDVFTLSSTAYFILKSIENMFQAEEIITMVSKKYQITYKQALNDACILINNCLECGVVEVKNMEKSP